MAKKESWNYINGREVKKIMLFNSVDFLFIFLPIVFFVYFVLNKARLIDLSKGWLVLSSLFFYSYWKLEYLPIILFSMVFNYSIGTTLLGNQNLKINNKFILCLGIIGNILLLGYFKYFDFLLLNLNTILKADFDYLNIVLPLAISFFTFQQIAYLVDSYKQETKEYDFLNYTLFITFFPQLIAGPIVHHKELMPQFENLKSKVINQKNISIGLYLLAIGLFKKVMIADNLSPFVHKTFDVSTQLTFFEAWISSFAYTFQIYFDFSGYTDMALGIGHLFNIKLPQNFNSPYKANNIQVFWRRWHMTLSRFLRDYIYIPLGGNKISKAITSRNLFLTFLIGGIWHDAAWIFVIWGALHGLGVVIHRFWQNFNIKLNSFVAVLTTFLFVNLTWVFFRAHTFNDALKVLKGMLGLSGFALPRTHHLDFLFNDGNLKISWLFLSLCFILTFAFKNSSEFANEFKPSYSRLVLVYTLLLTVIINLNKITEFLYFQF